MTEEAFLNCNIWSVHLTHKSQTDHKFFLIHSIYHYNSLTSGIVSFDSNCVQIPEFEIKDLHLLEKIDNFFINMYKIPIVYKDDNIWKINLKIYENFKLQSANI
jgi:hypothetical protein